MKINIKTRTVSALMSFLLISSCVLSGCSSDDSSSGSSSGDENTFHVVTYANLSDENFTTDLAQKLSENTESVSEKSIQINGKNVIAGNEESDPTYALGGVMELSKLMINKEIDILIAPKSELETNANQDSFMKLDELFDAEELETLGVNTLSFENAAGESGVYAVDLSSNSEITSAMNSTDVGAAVMVNTNDTELAKDILTSLIELYPQN